MTHESASPAVRLSRNLAHLASDAHGSLDREVERRRVAGALVADLAREEPAIDPPRGSLEAALKTLREGQGPTSAAGGLELRAAAARYLSLLSGGRPVNADHVVVSAGARHACFTAFFSLFEHGDHVLLPKPGWPAFEGLVRLARASPVAIQGDLEWSLKVSAHDLGARSDARTAGLVLSTPVNPTGAVYTRSELKTLFEWALERNLWIVCDETYRRVHYGSGPAPSALDLPDELLQRAVVVTGLDASHGLAGWQIAVALAPPEVSRAMGRVQEHAMGAVPWPAQRGAAAALSSDRADHDLARWLDTLREHRDAVVAYFRRELPGVEFIEPLGAYYFFFRVDGFFNGSIASARAFCERLVEEHGVALAHGGTFGDERWVRLNYAASRRDIEWGLEGLATFVRSLTGGDVS